jgi:hypothetical protein
MNDVLIINGERYRKCKYIYGCLEETLESEEVEIIEVRQIYKHDVTLLDLRVKMPELKFRTGDKIIITRREEQ